MNSELTEEILNLKDGDHLCLFYDREPAEQMPALVPFIQDGLTKDEQFIYIADDQTVDELAGRLEQSGINVALEVDRGALKLWTRREWRQSGRLSSEKKSLQVLDFINAAIHDGFKGSRFAVEMTWALGPDIRPSALEAWEATLNTIFVPGFQGRITCQYNRSRLSPEIMLAAFHTHPLAILGDHVYPNWFYEAPLILQGYGSRKNKSSTARVEWMISVLERSRAAQKEREELIEKRAALAESESAKKTLENILSLMPAAVYTCDQQGRITFFNRRAMELWGRAPKLNDDGEKFCGSFRLWRPDGSLLLRGHTPMVRALQTGEPTRNAEVTIERPDGSMTIVSVNVDVLHDIDGRRCGAINVLQDITELKKAEEAKLRLAAIVESSDDAIISKDLNGIIMSWNQAAERLFGYTAEEAIGRSITMLIPREHIHEESGILERIRQGQRVEHYETIRQRKDGGLLEISLTVSPIKDGNGRIIGASKIARDVTERNRIQKELNRREQELTAFFENSSIALHWVAPDGTIQWANSAELQMLGYAKEEYEGRHVAEFHADAHVIEDILARLNRGEKVQDYEARLKCKDGSIRHVLIDSCGLWEGDQFIHTQCFTRDITERKRAEQALREARDELAIANEELEQRVSQRTAQLAQANAALLRDIEEQRRLEEQLRQAQKMEGIGTLAGGIAHDFNNILNIIKGYASLIEQHPAADEKISESVSVIDESIERGASVVRQLLTLARKTEAHLASSDVNDIVTSLANLLRQTFPKTIDVSLELRPKLPAVLADPNQISQALLNLCVNARDAMPDGGKLRLKTKVVDAGQVQNARTQGTSTYVCVEVSDTGTGIADSIRNRVFEPFFTTKGVGEGTGLGLAMVYGIVKNHNGFVDVESESEHGTTFRLYIPLAPSDEKTIAKQTNGTQFVGRENGKRQKTILLAEDEQAMVLLLERTLSNHGYKVLTALDGEEAIHLYRQHKKEIDVVLLDIGLPKIAGWDVILRLKEENPNVSVIVASGYIDPAFKAKMHQMGVNDFIAKPYTPAIILEALELAIEKPNIPYLAASTV